ncbi:response regulator transcription factor [Hymenobacter sp. BT175]|uniref:response regulator n=1 Tax=Hymenobacter translucens TaxID=2886507 RepID=UPI001D0E35F4|nr:response regulator transcription factor [Hymenobacter translucens]MCC2548066.1 response regulator transcription factor [Hymenobacter translucens]
MPESSADVRIQVLLVDDHQMVIEGIKTLLKNEADIRVVAQANSGPEALRRLRDHPQVQVAIFDLNMPQMTGVELTRAVRDAYPQVRIIALSMFHDHTSITEVLEAGGAGYLLKNTSKQELGDAIRRVAAGQTYFSPEVGSTLLQNLNVPANRDRSGEDRPVELTAREREILQLIAQEYSNQHIAETLFISERTVETHRKNILTKTNSKSVVGLIQYALRHKLIS